MKRFLCLVLLCGVSFASEESASLESKYARYDGNKIFLEGDVVIKSSHATVKAHHALLIKDENTESAVEFPYLEFNEDVEVAFSNAGVLHCTKVVSDYRKLKSELFGSPEVHYRDERGEIFAQSGLIEYEEIDEKLRVKKLVLVGDVKMSDVSLQQYGFAELVEYFPEEKLLILHGSETQKVLFFDQAKGMQLSAQKIEARRKENVVQGLGDVSFIFKEEEMEKFKQVFHNRG